MSARTVLVRKPHLAMINHRPDAVALSGRGMGIDTTLVSRGLLPCVCVCDAGIEMIVLDLMTRFAETRSHWFPTLVTFPPQPAGQEQGGRWMTTITGSVLWPTSLQTRIPPRPRTCIHAYISMASSMERRRASHEMAWDPGWGGVGWGGC